MTNADFLERRYIIYTIATDSESVVVIAVLAPKKDGTNLQNEGGMADRRITLTGGRMAKQIGSLIDEVLFSTMQLEAAKWYPDVKAKADSLREQALEDAKRREFKLPEHYGDYMGSQEWAEKRRNLLDIYTNRCSVCTVTDHLHVHHRYYDSFGKENINDCVVLCTFCHAYVHPNSGLLTKWFKVKYPGLLKIIGATFSDVEKGGK